MIEKVERGQVRGKLLLRRWAVRLRSFRFFLALAALALFAFGAYVWSQGKDGAGTTTFRVAIAYDGDVPRSRIRDACESVLTEEGIPHVWVPQQDLLLRPTEEQLHSWQAIVFPDRLVRRLPHEMGPKMKSYVSRGGAVAVIFDAGTQTDQGAHRAQAVFAGLLGVEYAHVQKTNVNPIVKRPFRFVSAAAARGWQIPAGVLVATNAIRGDGPAARSYPQVVTRALASDLDVSATLPDSHNATSPGAAQNAPSPQGRDIPGAHASSAPPTLSLRHVGRGCALWVDLPLGALTAKGDDLPMRAVLRTFLETLVPTPHLVPAPGGVGGLVLDWRVDSRRDLAAVPRLVADHLLRPDLRCEINVTASPDHAGTGLRPEEKIAQLLKAQGIEGCSCTSDPKGAPRGCLAGATTVSRSFWSVPITPHAHKRSIDELPRSHASPSELLRWLESTMDAVQHERTVRLVCIHPHDLCTEPLRRACATFLDRVTAAQAAGRLNVAPIAWFAEFFRRFVTVSCACVRRGHQLSITLKAPVSLEDVTVAIPDGEATLPTSLPAGVTARRGAPYLFFTVHRPVTTLSFDLPLRRPR